MDKSPGSSADQGGEMLDLLDNAGHIIGAILRSEAHGHPGRRHRAVHVIIRNSRGDVLLQKRSPKKLIQPGKWDSSCGGHIPAGETWENGARRELEEELGLASPGCAALKFSHEYWWESPVETELVRTYLMESAGPFNFDPDEITEGRFWAPEELRSAAGLGLLTPNLEEELRRLHLLP